MTWRWLALAAISLSTIAGAQNVVAIQDNATIAKRSAGVSSAMIETPPSPSKLALIRRFLELNGTQHEIDTGSFLERYAMPGGPLLEMNALDGQPAPIETFQGAFEKPLNALAQAYAKHRQTWQEEYENHVNWEFSEGELRTIVSFLEGKPGQHFLEGRWRMEAYVGTNTEELIEQIVAEAEQRLQPNADVKK